MTSTRHAQPPTRHRRKLRTPGTVEPQSVGAKRTLLSLNAQSSVQLTFFQLIISGERLEDCISLLIPLQSVSSRMSHFCQVSLSLSLHVCQCDTAAVGPVLLGTQLHGVGLKVQVLVAAHEIWYRWLLQQEVLNISYHLTTAAQFIDTMP